MKKLFLMAALLVAAVGVSAQSPEEIQQSQERIEKLTKLQAECPKNCGLQAVDQLMSEAGNSASEALQISPLVQKFQKRVEEKDTDAAMVAELTELGIRISNQVKTVQKVGELVAPASQEIAKIKNPLKLKAPTQVMKYSKEVLQITVEETAFQAMAVEKMLEQLKN